MNDNWKKRGGTAIIIKKNIAFNHICFGDNNSILEKTIVSIKLKNDNKLFVISVYARKGNQNEFVSELNQLFEHLDLGNPSHYFIIAGDFNAKHTDWANINNNERGIKFKNWLDNNVIRYKINLYGSDSPSYPRGHSFIDLALADARISISEKSPSKLATLPFDSDHKALIFNASIDDGEIDLVNINVNSNLNYNRANWKKFQKILNNVKLEIPNNRNLINSEIDSFLDKTP
ncbi:hypothetical protein P5V15_011522 [Pogonomyrmex californicus]